MIIAICKRIAAIFYVGFLLSVAPAAAQDISLEDIKQSVNSDLESALIQLTAQREEITQEKIPLVLELNEAESEIRQLRNTAARNQAIRDSRELGLNDIQSRLEAWENENTYLVNLLDEYATRFQSNLNISEFDKYEEALDDYMVAQSAGNDSQQIESQLTMVELGLDRMRNSFGGTQHSGNIVNKESRLVAGTFTRFGPLVFFVDQTRQLAGVVTEQDGINAHILELGESLDQLTALTNGLLIEVPVDVTEGKVTAISTSQDSLLTQIAKGGIWIFPILLFALISLMTSLFKIVQIYRIKTPTVATVRNILDKIKSSDLEEAKALADEIPTPIGPMLLKGIEHSKESPELVEEVLYENILEARPRLGSLLPIIAITAATAPLLGLLGTVTGMINTFNLITLFGTGDARVLSSGISEALVTTEFGLIVAIPALIVHAMLSRKVKAILSDMEKYALIFSNGLSARADKIAMS